MEDEETRAGRARGTGRRAAQALRKGAVAERAPGYDSWIYEQLSGLCAPRPVPPSGPRARMGLLPFPAHVRYAIPVFISAAGPSRSPGGPQPRPARGGGIRRGPGPRRAGRRRGRPAAGDRRRRFGQDQYACPPRGPSDPERRRSPAHAVVDLLAPRRLGNGAPRGRGAAPGDAPACGAAAAGPALGGHLPCHWRAPAARLRAAHRPVRVLHHPGSGRRRGT